MSIQIEPVQPKDVYTIISLQARIWQNASSDYLSVEQMDYMFTKIYNPEYLKNEITSGQNYVLIYENNIPQGFTSHSASDDNDIYRLNKIFLLPESQGKGFGKILMKHVEDIARNRNAKFLDLYVNRNNPACEFYKKIGFQIQKEIDIPVGPYLMEDYVMRKDLS